MTLALTKPWEVWRNRNVATWPGRDEFMRLRPATRVLLLGLGGWAAGAFVLAVVTVLWPSSESAPDILPSHGRMNAQDFAAMTERPLFAKTRRAAPVAVFVPPAPAPRDRDLILKGVFVNGAHAQAFLTSAAEPQGRWLAANDTIGGWTIASLAPDEVRLKADGETLTVALHPSAGSPGAPLPPAAMPLLPRPLPSPIPSNRPLAGGGIEPGLAPDIQEMNSARAGLLGIGAKPTAKTP